MKAVRIIVADIAEADERMRAIFAGAALRFVRTHAEALRALEDGACDLLIIDVKFDDSRMFDLLRSVRAESRFAGVPVVCIKLRRNGVLSIGTQGLEVAVSALEGNAFIDACELSDEEARGLVLALL